MELYQQSENNDKNKAIAYIVSLVLHILLLLLFLCNFVSYTPKPAQDFGGITVTFGDLQAGNDDVQFAQDEEEVTEPSTSEDDEDMAASSQSQSEQNTSKTTQPIQSETSTELTEEVAAAPKSSTKENTSTKDKEVTATSKSNQSDEAKKKALAEAQKAQQQKQLEAKKKKYSNLFGSGSDAGKTSGDQGDPNGDPNKAVLESIGKGSGRIGGGLTDRGLLSEPSFVDQSQKTGKVVIKICVDALGNVATAQFTQRGSTTTDSYLVRKAIEGAKKYKFVPSEIEQQCGTVSVDFKVK